MRPFTQGSHMKDTRNTDRADARHRLPSPPSAREVAEVRFEKLFENADAMSIQGYLEDGTVVYWNRASELIYGYTADEALGRNLLELIIPEHMRERVREAMAWMFANRTGVPASRLDLRHKDGSRVPVFSSHTVVAAPGHDPVLFCMDADMRALARAEDELRIAATAFDSQQRMVLTDAEGIVLRVNRAFTETMGYREADVIGHPARILLSPSNSPDLAQAIAAELREAGAWQGEIRTLRNNGDDFEEWVSITAVRDPAGRVTHYVGWLTEISQRKEVEAKLVQLAFYDPLTDLPNRRLMHDRILQAMGAARRTGHYGALLLVDLDDFKTLNDTLGHDVGDRLLKELARRLRRSVRTNDTVARFGGDEFVVMLEDLGEDADGVGLTVSSVGQKLILELARPNEVARGLYQCSASVGAVLFNGRDVSCDELIKQAELAMYAAKRAGRATLRFFDARMQSEVSRRAELVCSLREGLAKDAFLLHYQPQVDHTGRMVGAEVLLRWDHPDEGLKSPGSFIKVAEESGVILALGNWVLDAACRTLVAWAGHPVLGDLILSVNVSALQFAQADFVAQLRSVLSRTGARPERLRLELTESMLIDSVEDVTGKMRALRALGVSFSLDDFGTGYSSLSYLHRLPFSELKIDQSFVRSMGKGEHGDAIVQTIIALGRGLGLSVIAEGVEETGWHEQLQALGCDRFQGYLYGRPMDLERFVQCVAEPPAATGGAIEDPPGTA